MGSSIITTLVGFISSLVSSLIPEIPKVFEGIFFTAGTDGALELNALGEISLVFLALSSVIGLFYTFKRVLLRR